MCSFGFKYFVFQFPYCFLYLVFFFIWVEGSCWNSFLFTCLHISSISKSENQTFFIIKLAWSIVLWFELNLTDYTQNSIIRFLYLVCVGLFIRYCYYIFLLFLFLSSPIYYLPILIWEKFFFHRTYAISIRYLYTNQNLLNNSSNDSPKFPLIFFFLTLFLQSSNSILFFLLHCCFWFDLAIHSQNILFYSG